MRRRSWPRRAQRTGRASLGDGGPEMMNGWLGVLPVRWFWFLTSKPKQIRALNSEEMSPYMRSSSLERPNMFVMCCLRPRSISSAGISSSSLFPSSGSICGRCSSRFSCRFWCARSQVYRLTMADLLFIKDGWLTKVLPGFLLSTVVFPSGHHAGPMQGDIVAMALRL